MNKKYHILKDKIQALFEKIKKDENYSNEEFQPFKDFLEYTIQFNTILSRGIVVVCVFIIALLCTLIFSTYKISELETINKNLRLNSSDSLLYKIMDVKFIESDTTRTRSFKYQSINGEPLTYNQLNSKNDSLIDVIKRTKTSADSLLIHHTGLHNGLDFIYEKYKIKVYTKYIQDSINGNYYSMEIPENIVDSALLLLPHYRDKLEYNEESDNWTITLCPDNE